MAQYQYDPAFFAYTTASNDHSAQRIAQWFSQWLQPRSVADFGCAHGAWLHAWQQAGAAEVQGVDGDYVDRQALRIAEASFKAADLAQPIDLGRKYALVQSVEVAEHLPASAARTFVQTLCRHGDLVLFSAAPPGQGGEHHVNEQPYGYWRDLFAAQGYACYDCVRPVVAGDARVQPWYRYNVFLYANAAAQLPAEVAQSRVPDGAAIADISPPAYKLRKTLVRLLPPKLADVAARLKARLNR